jgi:hypothetical protein
MGDEGPAEVVFDCSSSVNWNAPIFTQAHSRHRGEINRWTVHPGG